MLWVRPGVLLVRARPFTPVSALSSELLPTWERPANATSARSQRGQPSSANTEVTNSAVSFMIADAPASDELDPGRRRHLFALRRQSIERHRQRFAQFAQLDAAMPIRIRREKFQRGPQMQNRAV